MITPPPPPPPPSPSVSLALKQVGADLAARFVGNKARSPLVVAYCFVVSLLHACSLVEKGNK